MMYTIEERDNRWWVIEPNSGGRAISDSLYESDARAIADALNQTREGGPVDKLKQALSFYMSVCGNTAYSVTRESAIYSVTRESAMEAHAMGEKALAAIDRAEKEAV